MVKSQRYSLLGCLNIKFELINGQCILLLIFLFLFIYFAYISMT